MLVERQVKGFPFWYIKVQGKPIGQIRGYKPHGYILKWYSNGKPHGFDNWKKLAQYLNEIEV
jgi:hypothetical protein